jgi:hypothetical protein
MELVIHLLYPTCFRINITILPTFYAYMAWLLQYNFALNNGVNCMNHYTNLKVQTISKMSASILSVCYNIVCMHITTIILDPISRVSSCI